MKTPDASTLRPISGNDRIESLDVARGWALFGILMVNVQLLCQPMAWLQSGGGSNEGPVGIAAYYATRLFFESKSYPLFSLLFGMGLMLMRQRAIDAGRSFAKPYLRRLSMLLLMGVIHALLLYYADILIIYSFIGFLTMWLMGRKSKVIFGFSMALLSLALLGSVLSSFAAVQYYESKGAVALVDHSAQTIMADPASAETSFAEFFERIRQGEVPVGGMMSPEWESAAKDAYQHGPISHAIQMRGVEWLAEQLTWTIGSGAFLQISGMFFLGAWLMKIDTLCAGSPRWRRRFVLIGCLVGLPCAAASIVMTKSASEHSFWYFFSFSLMTLAGPCVSLGYMGLSMWFAERFADRWLARSIAATGRMALTNYIMQSFLVCAIAQHWGLAMFGDVSQAQMLAIAVSIYALQVVVSPLWLSRFTMGPLEWLWRWWTYLRRPAFVKT
jgi:uncharacterized protein